MFNVLWSDVKEDNLSPCTHGEEWCRQHAIELMISSKYQSILAQMKRTGFRRTGSVFFYWLSQSTVSNPTKKSVK